MTTTTNPVVTADLSAFGSRERRMAATLLTALADQGFPDNFEDDGVTVNMNMNSGFVFLSNSDYAVAMMNGPDLETFYSCPECGHEGFLDEMDHEGGADCRRYLADIRDGAL